MDNLLNNINIECFFSTIIVLCTHWEKNYLETKNFIYFKKATSVGPNDVFIFL